MKPQHYLFLILFILALSLSQFSCKPQSSVRQQQIDRNRKKNHAAAMKTYKMDLKKHHKNQSKRTRAMMKKSRRESKKHTPGRK